MCLFASFERRITYEEISFGRINREIITFGMSISLGMFTKK